MEILTVAGVAMLALEGIKFITRKYIMKDMGYDFSLNFYVVSIPVLELLAQPFLVWLGVLPAGAVTLTLQLVVKVVIESLISVMAYNTTIKPLKSYGRFLRLKETVEKPLEV
jgi:hypothetical protein